MRSLRARLLVLWLLSLAASVAVGVLLAQLWQMSAAAQAERASAEIAHACDLIGQRYGFYTHGWSGPVPPLTDRALRRDLTAAVTLALAGQDGVEGGIWQAQEGPLAYAYPTYAGSGAKTDLPAAERAEIARVNRRAALAEQAAQRRIVSRAQTLLLEACPLPGPVAELTAWTMTRVQAAQGLRPLRLGVGVLLVLMILLSGWIGRTLLVWGRHISGIEAALAGAGADGMPSVPRTGERELDRVIDALNDAGARLRAAQREAGEQAARAARAERLAGLGRMAAGIAHEIRNPLAAARLQGENALAGDDMRRRVAIGEMLAQVERLERLVTELLATTQRADPRPAPLGLRRFLGETAAGHQVAAGLARVSLAVRCPEVTAWLDATMVRRILDNLLGNAIRHAAPGGSVVLSAERAAEGVTLRVEDDGEGVPAAMAAGLFEPFVTGRPDGTGLGLAIARELAHAHGGRLELSGGTANGTAGGTGAVFTLELPCRLS